MQVQDDRNTHETFTHSEIVKGRDPGMSGWGQATSGSSYAGWACRPGDVDKVLRWAGNRGDIKRIAIVSGDYVPAGTGHYHIYVVNDGHNALK